MFKIFLKYILLLLILFFVSCENKFSFLDFFEVGWKGVLVCEVFQEDSIIRVLKCIFFLGVGYECYEYVLYFGYILKGSIFKIIDDFGICEVNVFIGYDFYKVEMFIYEV